MKKKKCNSTANLSDILLLKNGLLIDKENNYLKEKSDILIESGIIKKIAKEIRVEEIKKAKGIESEEKVEEIDLNGALVSPGFIDAHVHCFPKVGIAISAPIDLIGIKQGVTTLIDAGTAGANTVDEFYNDFVKKAKTNVYEYLNVSSDGLMSLSELKKEGSIDKEKIIEIVKKYPDFIVGLKVRMSSSVVGDRGLEPLKKAKKIARELQLPIIVHIGNGPPELTEIVKELEKGDVITHCYNNKANNIFDIETGKLLAEIVEAKKRGVVFDLGHGSASFSFETGKAAIEAGLVIDTISSDLYDLNVGKIVFSLTETMNKMLYLGLELEDVLAKVTTAPKKLFNLKGIGELKEGLKADLTIFTYEEMEEPKILEDSTRKKITLNKYLRVKQVVKSGALFEVK